MKFDHMGGAMNSSAALNSLLIRLRNAKPSEIGEVFTELLGFSNASEQLVPIIEEKLDKGMYVLSEPLATLIGRTHAPGLYAKARSQMFQAPWELLILYRSKYPDPEIEKTLCSKLYSIASNDGDPTRRHIVEAMREVGSEGTLSTLEAILYDLEPSAKVRKLFADSLGLEGRFSSESRSSFVQLLTLAIEAIKNRFASIPVAKPEATIEVAPSPTSEDAKALHLGAKARRFLENDDPQTAVIYLRHGTEALAKDLYRRLGCETNGRPARKMMLEELLKPIRESDAPELLKLLLFMLQMTGNFASHDQDHQPTYLTNEIAAALLVLFDQAHSIYSAWLSEDKRQ